MENKFGDFTLKIPLFAGVEVLVKEDQGVKEGQGVARIKPKEGKPLVEVKSPVEARIVDLEKDFLVLQFLALVFPAQAAFGKSGWGDLKTFSGHLFELSQAEEKIGLVENLTLAFFNKLEALEARGVVCLGMDKAIEQEAEEMGILVLPQKDYQKVCQWTGKRAKVDINDKRLIVAK